MVEDDRKKLDNSKDESKLLEKVITKVEQKTSWVESDFEDNSDYGGKLWGNNPKYTFTVTQIKVPP